MPAGHALICSNCAAPLTPDHPDQALVHCRYCGTTNQVAVAPPPPPASSGHHHHHRHHEHSGPTIHVVVPMASGTPTFLRLLIPMTFALLGLGGAAAGILARHGHSAGGLLSSITWVGGPFCEVDVNNDGTPDLVMDTSDTGSAHSVTAVDGQNGKVLWRAPLGDGSDKIHCAGDKAVVVGRTNFDVDVLSAKDGARKYHVTTDDKVDSVSVGATCVAVKVADGKKTTLGVDLRTWSSTACSDAKAPAASHGVRDESFQVNGITIHAIASGGATKRVTLTTHGVPAGYGDPPVAVPPVPHGPTHAAHGHAPTPAAPPIPSGPTWTTELDFAHDFGFHLHVVPVADGLFLAGDVAGKKDEMHYAFVRASDGRLLYEKTFATSGLTTIWDVTPGARGTVYVDINSTLYAYDAATGTQRWAVGR